MAVPARALDLPRMAQQAQRLGSGGPTAVSAVSVLLDGGRGLGVAEQLTLVNQFVNRRLSFATDVDAWGVEDHWASPLQALAQGRGDCEDYAIAKYFLLLELALPAEQLRLVYVRALQVLPGQGAVVRPHMVLAWQARPTDEPLVLDNLVPDIAPAGARSDLTPVYSFNLVGLWHGVAGASAGDPLARLSRWRDVVERARQEGFGAR